MKNNSYPVYLAICGKGDCNARWDVSTSYSPYRELNSCINQENATGIWKIYKVDKFGSLNKDNKDCIKYGDRILMVNMYLDAEYYLGADCISNNSYSVGLYKNYDKEYLWL